MPRCEGWVQLGKPRKHCSREAVYYMTLHHSNRVETREVCAFCQRQQSLEPNVSILGLQVILPETVEEDEGETND